MKLLLTHPAIAGLNKHPYEDQAAQYWLNAARILLQPRDMHKDIPITAFQQAMNKIYRNPFLSRPFLREDPGSGPVQEWTDHTYPLQTIEFFKLQIDQYYKAIAAEAGKGEAVFFAEKTQPNMHSEMYNEVYENPTELTLIRHPFDVLCSVRSFFRHVPFYKTDEYLTALDIGYQRLLSRFELAGRKNKAILYAELVSSPQDVMSGIFEFMGLEVSELPPSLGPEKAFSSHITSASAERSIHRWREHLSAQDQELAKAVFAGTMKRLVRLFPDFDPGYAI